MRARLYRVILAVAVLALAGCAPDDLGSERVVMLPSYTLSLGVHLDDVKASLGEPAEGPRFERLTHTTELVYVYPFPAIQTETHFPNGTTRSELVDRIYLFFDREGLLTFMTARPNRWYPTFTDLPVQRITVLPRIVHPSGAITPPFMAH